MLAVKLFGSGMARYYDRPMDGFPCHQSYLLFCYLLLHRQHRLNRERLAAVFWGNYATNVSRKYLRNALWKLRSVFQGVGAELDNYLVVRDDTIGFQNTSAYRLDVEAFEGLLDAGRNLQGEELSDDAARQLQQAVDLYDGDLLEGVDEEWCLYERERLSLMNLSALGKLIVYHRTHQTYTAGLDYGERILELDNTRENVHREMMLLYWLCGDPQMALVQYHRCEQILHDQVGVEPSEETKTLYQRMLHHNYEPPKEIFLSKRGRDPLADPSQRAVAEYAIREMHHLRSVIDQANADLQRLEAMLKEIKITDDLQSAEGTTEG
jgi:DNA-binding SARP family transcriptional activator